MKSRDRDEHISTGYARVSNPSFLSIIYGHMTHHVNPIKMILPVIGFPFRWPASTQGTIDSRARYVTISFRCDDVIILQFDWTFLVLGNRTKYLNLVHQTIFHVRIQAGYETNHIATYIHTPLPLSSSLPLFPPTAT